MGMIHKSKGTRLALLVAFVVSVAIVAAVAAQAAQARGSYEHDGATSCAQCHTVDTGTPPTNAQCTASGCHTGGYTALDQRTCWTCHTPGQDVSGFKTPTGCADGVSRPGCHADPAPHVGSTLKNGCTSCHSVTTSAANPSNSSHHVVNYTIKAALSLKLSATRITSGKTVTANGIMHRNATGGVVTIKVQKKNSSGVWKPLLKKLRPSTLAEKYSWKYKPLKKGSYRMQSSVPAADNGKILKGMTAWKTFKVR